MARERFQRLAVGALLSKSERETVDRIGALLFPFLLQFFDFGRALCEDQRFEDARPAETPGGDDDLLDQDGFKGIGGGETVAQGVGVGVEIVGVFRGDEDLRGGKSVLKGVETGPGFSCWGAGAGAATGVAAIGFVLFFSRHDVTAW
jgi:hypothetical protein